MKQGTEEIRLLNRQFIQETLQGRRIRPSTFIHEIQMPLVLFEEMKDAGLIDLRYLTDRRPNELNIKQNPIAFFEFKNDNVTVSFQHIYNREDFRTVVDRYLIIKAYGFYPIRANWTSKMNLDKKVKMKTMMEDTKGKRNLVRIMADYFKKLEIESLHQDK
jgi:hypothetical protein